MGNNYPIIIKSNTLKLAYLNSIYKFLWNNLNCCPSWPLRYYAVFIRWSTSPKGCNFLQNKPQVTLHKGCAQGGNFVLHHPIQVHPRLTWAEKDNRKVKILNLACNKWLSKGVYYIHSFPLSKKWTTIFKDLKELLTTATQISANGLSPIRNYFVHK